MAGPPKQSNALKMAKGSKKLHSGEDIAPELLTKIPDHPFELGEAGMDEWTRVCGLLIEQQVLTEWDLPSIKIMCMEWERYVEAVNDIRKNGTYQKSNSGYEQQRPVVAERDKGFANYAKLLDKFGGNAVSRDRIKRRRPIEQKANKFGGI